MIILLGAVAWIAVVAFVAVLCLAARSGDRADVRAAAPAEAAQPSRLIVVTRHPRALPGRSAEPARQLVEAGGVG